MQKNPLFSKISNKSQEKKKLSMLILRILDFEARLSNFRTTLAPNGIFYRSLLVSVSV